MSDVDVHPASAASGAGLSPGFEIAGIRADFPILAEQVDGKPLVYLDNAATTHKPRAVIDAISSCFAHAYGNVGRGVHRLAERATAAHEAAREAARAFLHAPSRDEIVFVRGTTEAMNLVAAAFGRRLVGRGDLVVVTALEHHSNFLPWQRLCSLRDAELRIAPLNAAGEVDLDALSALLGKRTRILALTHVSNVLGTVVPVREIARLAHARGVAVVVDGAQAVPHMPVDVRSLGCDFYAFSAHKVYGPSGVGVLWGKAEHLESMAPYQVGGGMVDEVGDQTSTFAPAPHRFEAGTPAIEGVVGMAAAFSYLGRLDRERAGRWETELAENARQRLADIPGVRVLGEPAERVPVFSFVVDGVHAHDLATVLDDAGVAVRAGHHCAQPLMRRLGIAATTRVSFALYNTPAEVDTLVAAVARAKELLT